MEANTFCTSHPTVGVVAVARAVCVAAALRAMISMACSVLGLVNDEVVCIQGLLELAGRGVDGGAIGVPPHGPQLPFRGPYAVSLQCTFQVALPGDCDLLFVGALVFRGAERYQPVV